MRIGILETGAISDDLAGKYGSYLPMFERLLGRADGELSCHNFAVLNGEMPESPEQMDGWVITGSRHGVYEALSWMEPLKAFLRECLTARVPVVGVCFGHQILAEAMGGEVVKSDRGWGLGVHEYKVEIQPEWMDGIADTFATRAIHQDQIVKLPPATTVLASSPFCPYAALAYGDPDSPLAISVQPHPEFDADYVRDVVTTRIGATFPEQVAARALQSLDRPVHNADWGRWMVRFLREAAARRLA